MRHWRRYAAHADARTIPRTLLALVLEERRERRAQSAAAAANAVRELKEPGGGAEADSPRSGGEEAEAGPNGTTAGTVIDECVLTH